MARQAFLVSAFLLFLNVSLVLCRDDYQQYYSNHYSHHHHKSTPADSVPSTEAPVSIGEETSVSGFENTAVKTTDEHAVKQNGDYVYYTNDFNVYNAIAIVAIVSGLVSLAVILIGLAIIFCCGKEIGRKVRPGFVFPAVGIQPQQPSVADSPQLAHNPQVVALPKILPPYTTQPAQKFYPPVQQQTTLQDQSENSPSSVKQFQNPPPPGSLHTQRNDTEY